MMRWEVGMDPHHIEPLMGHKVPGVTGEFYDRPTSGMLADKVADLNGRMLAGTNGFRFRYVGGSFISFSVQEYGL
jgi:hypothetical protein